MRAFVVGLLALTACKDSRSLSATCTLDRTGAAKPTDAMLAKGWALHDRNEPKLRGPVIACIVKGRKGVEVAVEMPAAKARTSESDGTARFELMFDKLDRSITELVFHGDGVTAKAPVPVAPRMDASATTDAGVMTVTGRVTGTTQVTLAGEPIAVDAEAFSTKIEVWPWLVRRLAAIDLPLRPVKSLTLLAIAGTPPEVDYEFVTTPAPAELEPYREALLHPGTAFPGAAPVVSGQRNRPTLAVIESETGARLVATDPTMPLGAVELIAHAKLAEEIVETCRYQSLEDSTYGDFPAIRKQHRFDVSVTAAATGAPVATGAVQGTPPPACPEWIDVPKDLDQRVFHGEMPTYDALRAYLADVTASPPKAR